jgi:predicted amidohydrolase
LPSISQRFFGIPPFRFYALAGDKGDLGNCECRLEEKTVKAVRMFAAAAAAGLLCGAAWAAPWQPIGRPVRIVSLSFNNKPLEVIRDVIDAEAARGVDLVVLPETWRGQKDDTMETLDGPAINAMSALARKHHTYIVSPMDRKDGGRRMNSAVLLDRSGKVVFVYDKVFPYWSEFDHQKKVDVGGSAPVYQADFGRIGLAICFDVNFPEVWKSLADQGAELVVWPSAYSAGSTLQAHALTHHFYIVTSTWTRDCIVYDITGEQILYQKSKDINVTHVTLDLDRGIYHQNFNIPKREKLLKERGEEVQQEQMLDREQWFVLRARRPGVSARELARQYGLEELRDYISRSRREIDAMRGWAFWEKAAASVAH